jgi:hypothetical protein
MDSGDEALLTEDTMDTRTRTPRWFTALAAVVVVMATLAPAAQAGHGRGDGRKVREARGGYVIERSVRVHRDSDAAPLLAGLIGGFVLGAIATHDQPVVHVSTAYWDPYCDESFSDLGRYEWHLRHHRHPWMVRVIDTRSGECVGREAWRDGGWRDDDWRDGGWRGDWRDDDDRGECGRDR